MFGSDAPELDRDAWLPRILGSRQFKEDPEQMYLDCYQALGNRPSRQERNLERLLDGERTGRRESCLLNKAISMPVRGSVALFPQLRHLR